VLSVPGVSPASRTTVAWRTERSISATRRALP
jgi:hypothetical protein